jgi:hypothetical protein
MCVPIPRDVFAHRKRKFSSGNKLPSPGVTMFTSPDHDANDNTAPAALILPPAALVPPTGRPVRTVPQSRDWTASLRTEGVCDHSAGHTYVGTAGHAGHVQFACSTCTQAHPSNTSIEAHLSTAAGPDADCSICMTGFESAGECVTACAGNHFFHRTCLDRWLAVRRSLHLGANCPLCNTKANPMPYGCRQ